MIEVAGAVLVGVMAEEPYCPIDCGGCSCHTNPPCHHCVEHVSDPDLIYGCYGSQPLRPLTDWQDDVEKLLEECGMEEE